MPRAKQGCWQYVTSQGKFGTGGSERWTCNLCGYKGTGGADRIKAHLARFGGIGVGPCSKPMPEKMKEELLEWVAAREMRRGVRASTETLSSAQSSIPPGHSSHASQGEFPSAPLVEDLETEEVAHASGQQQKRPRESQSIATGRGSLHASSIRASLQKQGKQEATQGIMRLFIKCGLSFNVVRTPAWKEAMKMVSRLGIEWEGPSYEELRGSELRRTKEIVQKQLEPMADTWKKYGCTLMCDGWTDIRKRNVYNILVHCCKGTMFLRAIDASTPGLSITGEYIFGHIRQAVLEIGVQNVVQVITDNGSNCVSMGRMLEQEFPSIVWTPCAAHSIDLLIEDVGKVPWIHDIFSTCQRVVTLFTKRPKLLSIFRSYSDLELLRPAKTRFAYMCIVMERLLRVRQSLMQTVVSQEWLAWSGHTCSKAESVRITCLSDSFWREVEALVGVMQPLYSMLRIVDMEGSTIGLVYEYMDRVGESLGRCTSISSDRLDEIRSIWRDRWGWFHRPIHGMAHILHPLWRTERQMLDHELDSAWTSYICRLYPDDIDMRLTLEDQLLLFRNYGGSFGKDTAMLRSSQLSPVSWWEKYGLSAPELRSVAIRVLSQDCSASPCERNWSTWALFHTKKRNRLSTAQLERLVYCHCNLRLLESGGHTADVRQVNIDHIDIEKVHEMPTIPSEELDLYSMLYQELTEPQHQTRSQRRTRSRAVAFAGASTSSAPHGREDEDEDEDEDEPDEDEFSSDTESDSDD
ncbi:hypothetical protein KP509_33G010500 [Ceratopteris richardii]|uniref:BED-type domain-containing protein n=1 Tax=Ceratopteris richardii TaxID=49495 RepID=A0A8T2QNC1_CERRI|nr:hypothetical protein KP509_33G010500 [Ceratopteris richardii]